MRSSSACTSTPRSIARSTSSRRPTARRERSQPRRWPGSVPQFQLTPAELDSALAGSCRSATRPRARPSDISHGDGFDRLNAIQQGIQSGASYCFSRSFLTNRTFTERGYVSDQDYVDRRQRAAGRGARTRRVSSPTSTGSGRAAATEQGKTFQPVKFAEADHPPCGGLNPASEFGYCADDNTVYYSSVLRPPRVLQHHRAERRRAHRRRLAQPSRARRLRARHAVRDRVGDGRPAPVLRAGRPTTRTR